MSLDDLTAFLREDLTLTEPPWSVDPAPAVHLGRRRLLRRRSLLSGATAAVLLAAGSLSLAGTHRVADHATDRTPPYATSTAPSEPGGMPVFLDQHARAILEATAPGLPAYSFRAVSDSVEDLAPSDYDQAYWMGVTYATGTTEYQLSVERARGEAEGSEHSCDGMLTAGYYTSCTVGQTAAGDVLVSRVARVVSGPRHVGWTLVGAKDQDPLTHRPLTDQEVWWQWEVKVVRSQDLVVFATETVHAPTQPAAEAALATPVDDLIELASDPALTIAEPVAHD